MLQNDLQNFELILRKAQINYVTWKFDKCRKDIAYAKSIDSNNLVIKFLECWLLLDEWKNKESLKLAKEIYKLWEINAELLRIMWLSNYRLWNRSSWIDYLEQAFDNDPNNWDNILDMIDICIIEKEFHTARELLSFYKFHQKEINHILLVPNYYKKRIWQAEALVTKWIHASGWTILEDMEWKTKDM